MVASIAHVVPAAKEADTVLLERGNAGPEFVAALTHTLWADGRPLTLVLDDLHDAASTAMGDELTTLIDRSRDPLRLVAISRTDPRCRRAMAGPPSKYGWRRLRSGPTRPQR